MQLELEEELKHEMGRKQGEPREIPIKFEEADEGLNEEVDPVAEPEAAGKEADPEGGAAAQSPTADGQTSEPAEVDPLVQLQGQVDSLIQEKSSLYDQLLRRAAEFENYRKRIERERAETYQRARAEILLEFLPVIDNFERALTSLETSTGDADALRHGVELIHKQFKDALAKFGLEAVDSVGQVFDPNVHEAVTIEATDRHKENTIIEEFQRGYRMGDKLLRPAKVKVAASPNE
jgi:molecular chaperone GrpE